MGRGALLKLMMAVLMAAAIPAIASTSLSRSRVVVREAEREGSIVVRNVDAAPALVQAWIDDGRSDLPPEQLATPFQLVPPLVRIEAESSQRLRVMVAQPQALRDDRESLYWLNLVEVPRRQAGTDADPADSGRAELQVVVRSRLKLIYRPAAISEPKNMAAGLTWSLSPDGRSLTVRNDSPWVISLARLSPEGAGDVDIGDGVVLPMTSRSFDLQPVRGMPLRLVYEWMDDYGAPRRETARITR